MYELTNVEIEFVSGGGLLYDIGYAVGKFVGETVSATGGMEGFGRRAAAETHYQ